METINNITVKVTYTVGLSGLKVSKEVMNQLNKIADEGEYIDFASLKYPEASDWIQENIKERDCFEANFEIIDLD